MSEKRKKALSEARWIARRLHRIVRAEGLSVSGLDPELMEYLNRHDRPAKWLTNGVEDAPSE